MTSKPLNILPINPGTRYLGTAVFRGTELYDWAMRVVKGSSVQEKEKSVERIILEYVDRYRINTVVIKKLHPHRASSNLRQLIEKIRRTASQGKIAILELSIEEMKTVLLSCESGSRRLVMNEVVERYPFLHAEAERMRRGKNPYLIRMFEAVGLGTASFRRLDVEG